MKPYLTKRYQMNKLLQILNGFALISILISCKNDKESSTDVFTKIYSVNNILTQTFEIDAEKDNIITGTSGTKIRINRNTFIDSAGQPVLGKIEIRLKEALTRFDIVSGNLTTNFENKPLETGGMLFIGAVSNGKKLSIAENKEIQIALPTDSTLTGMSLFEGEQDSLGVKWNRPHPLPIPDSIAMEKFEKTSNVFYRVEGFNYNKEPDELKSEIYRIGWDGDGMKISKDSSYKIGDFTIHLTKQKKLYKQGQTLTNERGTNRFAEDRNTNYFFSIKKLGWANIDRLLADPRTKEVELITSIENQSEFNFIYVTLITQNMYLPGYQKEDETFCFSHNDEEKQQLPVGETATILATAYKNNKPYFALKKITITDKQTVSFKLKETTIEKLKTDLQEKI